MYHRFHLGQFYQVVEKGGLGGATNKWEKRRVPEDFRGHRGQRIRARGQVSRLWDEGARYYPSSPQKGPHSRLR